MPELEPCYLATAEALVVGWNRAAVELALAGDGDGPPAVPARAAADASRFTVALDRLPEADRRLAAAAAVGVAAEAPADVVAPVVYPWRSLVVTGRRVGDRTRLVAELEPR